MVLGSTYLIMNMPDSALIFANEGETYAKKGGITKYLANIYYVMAEVNRLKGNDSLALKYFDASLHYAISEENMTVVASSYEGKIKYYLSRVKPDSVISYGRKQLTVLRSLGAITALFSSENNLGNAYKSLATGFDLKKQTDSANKYLRMALEVNDSLTLVKQNRLVEFQRLTLDEQIRVQNQEKDRLAEENRKKTLLLFSGIAVALLIILLIYRNNRQKQKAYDQLQVQKVKTDAALQELKATQAQLIQSEKMASLGELTAGIAHEIQNPLNFVNNFSEINAELSEEILEAAAKGDIEEVKALASDIKSNQEKIREHGKRADSIVKGMLQHSRSSSGAKEPTDISALADEYLRLAYHGMRAKDKAFNASIKTAFEPNLPLVPVVAQDIGRVLLNLFNNAFYAVSEKQRAQGDGYQPELIVQVGWADDLPGDVLRTRDLAGGSRDLRNSLNQKSEIQNPRSIVIAIADNGNGIPNSIKDKIFQPFFTTKPTGQGTGLGLSLSYDIVTKGHGGELTVDTVEGKGSIFSIKLPLQ
jgi:signal transduction histidine kinase